MNELALFAGAGGGILGGHLLGWRTVAAVEIEPYAREVLLRRQLDGILPRFPIWDDIRTFDGRPWAGHIDIVTGGFPCQDISAAGKGAGIDGSRSGLWSEMFRIISEVRPRFAFMENSPMLTSRGLGRVLGDLASIGYDAEWIVLGADDVGAPHRRERIWILARRDHNISHTELLGPGRRKQRAKGIEEKKRNVAYTAEKREHRKKRNERSAKSPNREALSGQFNSSSGACCNVPDANSDSKPDSTINAKAQELQEFNERTGPENAALECSGWWRTEPALGRVAHGVAHRVDRLGVIGNGQVPLVAAIAFLILCDRFID